MSDNRPAVSLMVYAALACSVTLNVFLLMRGGSEEEPATDVVAEAPQHAAPSHDAKRAARDAEAPEVLGEAPARDDEVAAKGEEEPAAGDWQVLRGEVEQSLARTFQVAAGEGGDALASVFTRLFVWELDLRRDLQRGDALAVAWREGADGIPEIAAASLQTKKLGRKVAAYKWKAPGDTYASYWHLDGKEAPLRLKDGPLAQYEQITSLLKDRPSHKGMDFKTPVGTEVVSPRAGTVTRVNWNWKYNGNCIEVRYEDGVLAKFLHLSENKVAEGQRVSAGQVIALSGNTGHSTAPHLHYQLDQGEKTLDPLDYHGTTRRTLPPDQVAALRSAVGDFEKMLEDSASADQR